MVAEQKHHRRGRGQAGQFEIRRGLPFRNEGLRRDDQRQVSDGAEDVSQRQSSACECDVSEGYGFTVTVRKGAVETIEHNRDKGMGVTGAAFNALVEDLVSALDTFNVPEKEKGELLSVLGPMNKDIVEKP